MAKLSVIITAFDKHNVTVAHFRECMKASRLPDEIIIINDHGDPCLKEMLEKVPRKCPLIYSRINEDIVWNYNGAYNLGIWLSKGDYLMFEDNDNIPMKDTYRDMLKKMEERPDVGKLIAYGRAEIEQQDLDKPSEEWKERGGRGPNMGTHMIRRDIVLKVKGQDERFCGRYGWMYYDYKSRLVRAGTLIENSSTYWYVRDAQSNLDRRMSSKNCAYYRQNARLKRIQPPEGILNFSYDTFYYN